MAKVKKVIPQLPNAKMLRLPSIDSSINSFFFQALEESYKDLQAKLSEAVSAVKSAEAENLRLSEENVRVSEESVRISEERSRLTEESVRLSQEVVNLFNKPASEA
jgi:predicted nuclease with TOPRIM domain